MSNITFSRTTLLPFSTKRFITEVVVVSKFQIVQAKKGKLVKKTNSLLTRISLRYRFMLCLKHRFLLVFCLLALLEKQTNKQTIQDDCHLLQ